MFQKFVFFRYAVQLATPAKLMSQVSGRQKVSVNDIEECKQLFCDAKTSAKLLSQAENKLIV